MGMHQRERLFRKYLFFFGSLLFVLVVLIIVNFLAMFNPRLDQFNVFYRFQKAYSLSDWNLPHNVTVDIDNDGKLDKVTFYGCIFLSSVDPKKIPQKDVCFDSFVAKGKTKGFQMPRSSTRRLNSYLAEKNGSWFTVVNSLGGTKLYRIDIQGSVGET